MSTFLADAVVLACLFTAVFLGMRIRRRLPEHHLSPETKDTVKLAMGMVATMSALLLGLLVSSAKGSYDTARSEVIQLAAKVSFLDRVLAIYGPETAQLRAQFRSMIEGAIGQMWPKESNVPAHTAAIRQAGDTIYGSIQSLSPQNDLQRSLKAQAASLVVEIAQLRTLLAAQSAPSISQPLLLVVVCWLVVIFLGFSVLAPPNATATLALLASAVSVAGAIFLILELDRPFGGAIQISSQPLLHALSLLSQ